MKAACKYCWLHLGLVLSWTLIGLSLRLTNLSEKPLWTDEFSTIVFSLGNSFLSVPLDQALTSEQLLSPLVPNPQAGVKAVINHLLEESNHPPVYFILSHFWLKLLPTSDGLVSAQAARSLSAILGAVSIPASFILARMAFCSHVVGHMTAAFMAVSPFGIYLAQEARHYTLAILWVIVSLYCMVKAAQNIRDRIPLPLSICTTWIVVNALGLATHYFVCLTLGIEGLVISSIGFIQSWQQGGMRQSHNYSNTYWQRIWWVAAGTLAALLVWIPLLPKVFHNELTNWLYRSQRSGLELLGPIGEAMAGWTTMLYILPIQTKSRLLVTISGVLLILLVIWTIPKLYQGLKAQLLRGSNQRLAVYVFLSFVGGAIVLFFGIVYVLSTDLTSVFRYNFVYFPGVIVLVGAGLASNWNRITHTPLSISSPDAEQKSRGEAIRFLTLHQQVSKISRILLGLFSSSRKTVIIIWLVSLLGGLSVITNTSYQKTHRPDVVARAIQQESQGTVLMAIAHQHHGQTGRLMAIALELQQHKKPQGAKPLNPLFWLAHPAQNPQSALDKLNQSMSQLPHPLDLWLVNFQQIPEQPLNALLNQQNCVAAHKAQSVDGYRYRLYHC